MNEKEIKRGDIYYADLEPTRGHEQGGIRPVLIVSNDRGNLYGPTVIIAPITGQKKKSIPTHVNIGLPALPKLSTVLLEQIRTVDKTRLSDYVGKISGIEMRKVEWAMDISLGMVSEVP